MLKRELVLADQMAAQKNSERLGGVLCLSCRFGTNHSYCEDSF